LKNFYRFVNPSFLSIPKHLWLRMRLLKSLKPYWLWFYIIISLLSVKDFFAHLGYSTTSYFQENWYRWLLFTAASMLLIFIFIYFTNLWLGKIFKSENIFTQLVAISLGMFIHINLSGPILDWIIFQKRTLMFHSNHAILLLWLSIFCILRVVFYLKNKYRSRLGKDTQ